MGDPIVNKIRMHVRKAEAELKKALALLLNAQEVERNENGRRTQKMRRFQRVEREISRVLGGISNLSSVIPKYDLNDPDLLTPSALDKRRLERQKLAEERRKKAEAKKPVTPEDSND